MSYLKGVLFYVTYSNKQKTTECYDKRTVFPWEQNMHIYFSVVVALRSLTHGTHCDRDVKWHLLEIKEENNNEKQK